VTSGEWCIGSNWSSGAAPTGAGTTANFTATGAAVVISVTYPTRVGTMNFNTTAAHSIIGSSPLTLLATNGAGMTVLAGDHTISAPLILATTGAFHVAAGASLDVTSLGQTSATINKTGSGTLRLGNLSGATLSIAGGTVQLSAGMSSAARITSLNLTSGALDLNNNALVIDYTGATPANTIRGQLFSAFAAGSWNGTGVTSAHAAAIAADNSNSHKTAIAYAEASLLGLSVFKGQPVDATALLLCYMYSGDANLDGVVNGLDFNALVSNFGAGSLWTQGDFNYDGTVNTLDFSALTINFNLTMAPAMFPSAPVPEGGLIGLLMLPLGLLRRSRRET
jgi:hypothetical protein